MNKETLQKAVELAEEVGHVVVATADATGLPHLAAASKLSAGSDGQVTVAGWFCPGTAANVDQNRHISLVVWDPTADEGYQLVGRVEHMVEIGVLDGYAPEVEGERLLPQVERALVVRVDRTLRFTPAPHSDEDA